MNTSRLFPFVITILYAFALSAQTPPDWASSFDASTENWRTADAGVSFNWQVAGGNPDGHLRGTGTNATWHFLSPVAWAGDWRGYQTLKFDLILFNWMYPDSARTNIVVIRGTNGVELVWNGLSPDPTWTHYEVQLTPASFLVNQATYDSVMQGVAELRILGEYSTATETCGLDNVLLTAQGPAAFTNNLTSTFGTDYDNWRVVDDGDLSWRAAEYLDHTGGMLACNDKELGRTFWLASPAHWSGDWRAFNKLILDFAWLSGSPFPGGTEPNFRIVGGNGFTMSTHVPLGPANQWGHYVIDLSPATFDVSQALFDAIMSHVVELRWRGEYVAGNESCLLDNVILTGDLVFPPKDAELTSGFDAGMEGWRSIGASLTHQVSGGDPGGFLRGTDNSGGVWHFVSPESWAGNWSLFKELRFKLKALSWYGEGTVETVRIRSYAHEEMVWTNAAPVTRWTPHAIALTPADFGVDRATFDRIIANVLELRIRGETTLSGFTDESGLDSVWMRLNDTPIYAPDRASPFDADSESWRPYGGVSMGWQAAGGNPGGFLQGADNGADRWGFASPESWNGDWRAYRQLMFDFRIVAGGYGFGQDSVVAILGANGQWIYAGILPLPDNTWRRYTIPLTATNFGVSEPAFQSVMANVVELVLLAEVVYDFDAEAIDNVVLTSVPSGYETWKALYWTGADLTNEAVSGLYADPDGDGPDNFSEFTAGTIPTNRLDYFRIERIVPLGQHCRIEWLGHTGRLYGLQSAPALPVSGPWTVVTNNVPGAEALMNLEVPRSPAKEFYRLNVFLAP